MIYSIIPARGGSKGLPGKNIANFCGMPLVSWSIKQAKGSAYIDEVYVTSDSDKILKIARKNGARVIKRPKALAHDTSPVEAALLHALEFIQNSDQKKIEMIIFLQPTSPVRTCQDINKAIEFFRSSKADTLFSGSKLVDFCAWKFDRGKLISTSYDYRNRGRRQDRKPYFLENGSIYIFRPDIFKKYKNRLAEKIVFYEMPLWKSFEIDTSDDFEICRILMLKKLLKKRYCRMALCKSYTNIN